MTSRKIPESAVENLVSDLEGKANVANTVTTDTTQTITASKNLKTGGTGAYGRPFQIFMPTSTESNPTENKAREIAFVSSEGAGERYEGSLTHQRITNGESYTGLRAGRLVNGTYKEGALGVRTTADGTTFGSAPSTPANSSGNVIVTADYVQNKYVDKTSTQTISGSKRFTTPPEGMSIDLVADTNQQTVPTTGTLRQLGLYRNSTYTKGDGYTSWIQGLRGSDGWTATELYARRFLESDSQEIINYLRVNVTPEGVPISYTKTPPAVSAGEEIVTAGWFRQSGCVVRTVIETYKNGTNWYRIWSDGWKEQGGRIASGNTMVTFLKPFTDTNYCVSMAQKGMSSSVAERVSVESLSTTAMTISGATSSSTPAYWRACGY